MRGGARAIFLCMLIHREIAWITCTQLNLSSFSQAYVDFKWVCLICQFRQELGGFQTAGYIGPLRIYAANVQGTK